MASDVQEQGATAGEVEELRFAVVLNGGVSLAVWMGGVALEVQRLTRGSSRVYEELLRWAGCGARVDVISGTSAGGINGAALALAQINKNDRDGLARLREVWLHSGNLELLLNPPLRGSPPSLLQGDAFYLEQLRDAMGGLVRDFEAEQPSDRPMDLTITTTLLNGVPGVVVDDAGQNVGQVRHDGLIRFRRGDADLDEEPHDAFVGDDGGVAPGLTDALALAARASSSFPFAFEPSFLSTVDPDDGLADSTSSARVNMSDYLRGAWDQSQRGEKHARFAVDGGVLANTPTRPALEAIDRLRADGLVRRVLLLVHPHAPPIEPDVHDVLEEPPSLLSVGGALLRVLSSQGSRNHVEQIQKHNDASQERLDARGRIVAHYATSSAGRSGRSSHVRSPAPVRPRRWSRRESGGSSWTPTSRRDGPAAGSIRHSSRGSSRGGSLSADAAAGYWLYRQVRLHRASRDIAEALLAWAPPGGRTDQAAKRERRRIPREFAEECSEALEDRFLPVGVPRRVADLGFEGCVDIADIALDYVSDVLEQLADDRPRAGTDGDEATALRDATGALTAAKKGIADQRRAILRARRTFLDDHLRKPPEDWEPPLTLRDAHERARAIGSAYAQDRREFLEEPMSRIARHLWDAHVAMRRHRIRGAIELDSVLFTGLRDEPSAMRRLMQRLRDLHVLTHVAAPERRTESSLPVDLVQLTFQVEHDFARGVDGSAKIAGDTLSRFSGFLKASWRLNDWIWGRLDASRVLCQTVLEPTRVGRFVAGDASEIETLVDELFDALFGEDVQLAGVPDRSDIVEELTGLVATDDGDASTSGGTAADRPLEQLPKVFAAAIALDIARDELPRIPEVAERDVRAGASERSRAVDAAKALERKLSADGGIGEGSPGGNERAWDALRTFGTSGIGLETAESEASSDQLIRTAATAAATAVTVIETEGKDVPVLGPAFRILRGAALVPYWAIVGLTGGGAMSRALAQLSFAIGAVLVTLGLLGAAPTWVFTAGGALTVTALLYAAMRTGTLIHGVALVVPAVVLWALAVATASPDADPTAGATATTQAWQVALSAAVLAVVLYILGSLRTSTGPYEWTKQNVGRLAVPVVVVLGTAIVGVTVGDRLLDAIRSFDSIGGLDGFLGVWLIAFVGALLVGLLTIWVLYGRPWPSWLTRDEPDEPEEFEELDEPALSDVTADPAPVSRPEASAAAWSFLYGLVTALTAVWLLIGDPPGAGNTTLGAVGWGLAVAATVLVALVPLRLWWRRSLAAPTGGAGVARFGFRFERAASPLRLLGITPATAWVDVGDEHVEARFGPWSCRTPLSNVADVRTTWDYSALKAIGPRGSFADRGATFGTATRGGVCICFHEPVSALTPLAIHPALTVTVEDVEGLAALLRERTGGDGG